MFVYLITFVYAVKDKKMGEPNHADLKTIIKMKYDIIKNAYHCVIFKGLGTFFFQTVPFVTKTKHFVVETH